MMERLYTFDTIRADMLNPKELNTIDVLVRREFVYLTTAVAPGWYSLTDKGSKVYQGIYNAEENIKGS